MWDLGSILILGSVSILALILLGGSILEMRGIILFEHQEKAPVVKGRYGMAIMWFGGLMFIVSLVLRTKFTSDQISPFVFSGYFIWVVGGIIALIRNELLKMLGPQEKQKE